MDDFSSDSSFAEKIVSRVLSLDKAFAKLGDKEAKAQHKIVRQAERLYLKAAEAAGNNAIQKMILAQVPELEEEVRVQMSIVQKDGKFYTPTDEEIIKNHPAISEVSVDNAKYSPNIRLSDEEYKAYRKEQSAKAAKNFGVYTNKDTSYSDQYGQINAEFGNMTVRKGKSYGGVALYDILPQIPFIFENAIVLDTKPDSDLDTNIKGVVDLVGCATLNDKYLAIVKLNVKEYANDEAKIYDNKVLTIEELTVVDRVGLPDAEASSDSTSSAVSSKYIISRFRELVKGDEKKVQLSLKDGANQQTSEDIDEVRELSLQDLYDMDAENFDVADAPSVRINDWSNAEENVDDSKKTAKNETPEETKEAPKEEASDEPQPKKTGYTYDDIHGMMDEVKKGLRMNCTKRGRTTASYRLLYTKLYKMQILYN